ncbi:MAG: outer membrane protein transport protein [Deltaproteobacteria bacterium]|nr:outer membrane protein transport protein [Deltaproteobacteria bacterium]
MKKTIAVATLGLLVVAGTAYGSGYRIPEQSVNSTARAGANVAYTPSADAAFFNPANMSWFEDRAYFEVNATYIGLKGISYSDNRTPMFNGKSEYEYFILPSFFAVSPDYNGFRVGLSLDAPAGLSKKWNQPYPRTFAKEFSLEVLEANPTVSYKTCDMFSLAVGIRAIYSHATVKSAGLISRDHGGVTASRDMDGNTWEVGYNLAATVRPVDNLNLAVTYRSNINLDLEGDALLLTSAAFAGSPIYQGSGAVTVPLPAVLAIAGSYTFFDQLTFELEYDRTFWSKYETLDFVYPTSLGNPFLTGAFDLPKAKDWDDSDTWRISVSYDINAFTLMAGFAVDNNPVPDATLAFDLPDSDAKLYSLGLRYQINADFDLGIAYLYDDKDSRSGVNEMVNGTFDDAGAHLVTVGFSYKL